MRKCTECLVEKPLSHFDKDHRRKSGKKAKCKTCCNKIHGEYRRRTGYDKRRYWKNPAGERERHLIRKYGVTLADYEEMLRDQDGRCAVCGKIQERAFDVDHDHKTGKVRGLLCTSCNRMLGHSGDSPELLIAGADYLRKSRPNS